ncbi:asparagine synthase-related protein [Nanoarchaeota archaeon]
MGGVLALLGKSDVIESSFKAIDTIKHRGKGTYIAITDKKYISETNFSVFTKKLGAMKSNFVLIANMDKKYENKSKPEIVLDGTIYNMEKVGRDNNIKAKDEVEFFHKVVNKNDVEIIDEIDGDYAFISKNRNKIYIGRDILGIQPLCYGETKELIGVASEHGALEVLGLKCNVFDPKELFIYDIKTGRIMNKERRFYSCKPTLNHYKKTLIEELKQRLTASVKDKIGDEKKVGLLFSGGLDSSLVATLAKKAGRNVIGYNISVDYEDGKDYSEIVKRSASMLGIKLRKKVISLKQVEKFIKDLNKIVDVHDISVALPLFVISELAKKDKVKILLSGDGSEEIFAGHEKHMKCLENYGDINYDCLDHLKKLHDKSLYVNNVIIAQAGMELKMPFYNKKLVNYVIKIPPHFKINKEEQKIILKEVSMHLGVPKEIVIKSKVESHFNIFNKAIEAIASEKGFENKEEYLESLR